MQKRFLRTTTLLIVALSFSGIVAFQANGATNDNSRLEATTVDRDDATSVLPTTVSKSVNVTQVVTTPAAERVGGIVPQATGATIELLHEDFEVWPLSGWNIVNNGGDCIWMSGAAANTPRANDTGGIGDYATADSDDCGNSTTMDTELQSPVLNLAYAESASLSYLTDYQHYTGIDGTAEVLVSDDGGSSWTTVLSWNEDHSTESVTIDLSPFIGSDRVIVSFHYTAAGWAWWWQVDQVVVTITTPTTPPPAPGTANSLLYDNGNPATRYEVGSGAANVSEVQSSLGKTIFGYGNQLQFDNRLADDFTIDDAGGWDIDYILVYGYQTGSSTASTFTAINLQIWDGPPGDPGSMVVWGNSSSNVMVSSEWSGIYRISEGAFTDTNRPVMLNTVAVSTHLDPGTYWLDWQADGTMASGPWVPPLAVTGVATTGDALQSTDAGATWNSIDDNGSGQGFPFRISGTRAEPVLFSNGPLANLPDGGSGNGDQSVLQSVRLGMGTYGFGHQVVAGNRIADDFTISNPKGWRVEEIVVYAYQTGSTTTSTFTAVNLQIWDGPPGDPSSTVVWGDTSSNVMAASQWSGIYRVLDNSLGSTARPIMINTLAVKTYLPQGTYWLDWQADGTLASGPWAPPISLNGQQATGNGIQSVDNGITWNSITDAGANQGFPFVIKGRELYFPWPMFTPATNGIR